MKINAITTKSDETLDLGEFSILVGPNNTGKSQTLRDIHDLMSNGLQNTPSTIVTEIDFEDLSYEDLMADLSLETDPNRTDRYQIRGIGSTLSGGQNHNTPKSNIERYEGRDGLIEDNFVQQNLLQYKVAFLDASSRLEVATQKSTFDTESSHPNNALQKLYTDSTARKQLREAFRYIFDKDILLDYSSLQNFKLKIKLNFGEIEGDKLGPNDEVDDAKLLDEQGAGYRGLAGVVIGLLLSKDRVVLLDEPEAFLHPAQARRFGSWLGNHIDQIEGQLLISTHNSHFLSGVLSSSSEIQIFRLNRVGNTTKYNGMSPEVTSNLATDPLLSSQRVIDAVFHKGVIVCEGDSDSTIYRYSTEHDLDRGQYLFTHGQNKQTIPRVAQALNDVGVPQAAIVDLDVVKNPSDAGQIIESIQGEDSSFADICNQFNQQLRASSVEWEQLENEGIDAVDEDIRQTLQDLIDEAARLGLFIVPVGELEGWIDVEPNKGARWVVAALDDIDNNGAPESLLNFQEDVTDYIENRYESLVVPESEMG